MKTRQFLTVLVGVAALSGCDSTPVYLDKNAPAAKRAASIVSKMTLEE